MSIGSILLGLSLLILVALFLARPFLAQSSSKQQTVTQKTRLLAEKEAVLVEIKALDFDRDTGKIPDDVHQAQRAALVQHAAETLKELDQLTASGPDRDDAIEAAVQRMRSGQQKTAVRQQVAGGFCPQCGIAVAKDDKFCASCGHKLVAS